MVQGYGNGKDPRKNKTGWKTAWLKCAFMTAQNLSSGELTASLEQRSRWDYSCTWSLKEKQAGEVGGGDVKGHLEGTPAVPGWWEASEAALKKKPCGFSVQSPGSSVFVLLESQVKGILRFLCEIIGNAVLAIHQVVQAFIVEKQICV